MSSFNQNIAGSNLIMYLFFINLFFSANLFDILIPCYLTVSLSVSFLFSLIHYFDIFLNTNKFCIAYSFEKQACEKISVRDFQAGFTQTRTGFLLFQ